jgi:hypothetical protein
MHTLNRTLDWGGDAAFGENLSHGGEKKIEFENINTEYSTNTST